MPDEERGEADDEAIDARQERDVTGEAADESCHEPPSSALRPSVDPERPLVVNAWTEGYETEAMDLLAWVPVTERFALPPAPEHAIVLIKCPNLEMGRGQRVALVDPRDGRLQATARQPHGDRLAAPNELRTAATESLPAAAGQVSVSHERGVVARGGGDRVDPAHGAGIEAAAD